MAISDIRQLDGRHHDDDDRQPSPDAAQPMSINRLAALHSRERLLLNPLFWTSRQPTLLGCRIHFRGEGGVVEDRDSGKRASDELVALLGNRLNRQTHGDEFQDTIWNLLSSVSGHVSADLGRTHEVRFYFNQRPCTAIRFYYFKVKALQVACIDASAIDLVRRTVLRRVIRPGPVATTTNWPGIHRYRAFCRRYHPPSPEQDPCLVALVIGLAQTQRGGARERHRPTRGGCYTVRVVFAGSEHPAPLHVLVAHVTPAFLARLDFPAQAPSVAAPGLDIHHWRVSAHPLETLPHRLVRCLEHECCGETHAGGGAGGGGGSVRPWPILRSGQKRKWVGDGGCC